MTAEPGREIYVSANGDCWHLLCDPATGHSFVHHRGNVASGGYVTEIGRSAFLAADRGGPEHRALTLLIAPLTEAELRPAVAAV